MFEPDLEISLPEVIEFSFNKLDMQHYAEKIKFGLQAIMSGDYEHSLVRETITVIFNHMAKDSNVIAPYIPVLKLLATEHNGVRLFLSNSLTKRCPKPAQALLQHMLNEISVELGTHVAQKNLDDIFKPLQTIYRFPIIPEAVRSIHTAINQLKKDWAECEILSLTSNESDLNQSAQARYRDVSQQKILSFLQHAKQNAMQNNEETVRYLMYYCFSKGQEFIQNNKLKESRDYLLLALFLQSQLDSDAQRASRWELYNGASMYFTSYNLRFNLRGDGSISERFYNTLLITLEQVNNRVQQEGLGRAFVEIDLVNSWLIRDNINRLKQGANNTGHAIHALGKVLQVPRVFLSIPLNCMELMERIDITCIALAISQQLMSTANERRLIATSLIRYAHRSSLNTNEILGQFSSFAKKDQRLDLAFSLLVEPFILKAEDENKHKTMLIALILGFSSENLAGQYFIAIGQELVDLFDKFVLTNEPNQKNNFGVAISERIRVARRYYLQEIHKIERLETSFKDTIVEFFTRVNNYVTSEQAKLIHNTDLEVILINDRSVFSDVGTRITLEINNSGEGMAEHILLRVFPVETQYDVDERYKESLALDILQTKESYQIELYIKPRVKAGESVELNLELEYNTLSEKGKLAYLSEDNKIISLYPETQFVRIKQPYSISDPATTWFFGRHNLLDNMLDNLHLDSAHDNSIILYGLRRAGKTSVVKRFISQIESNEELKQVYITSYVDLLKDPKSRRIKDDSSFLQYLIEIVFKSIPLDIRRSKFSNDINAFKEDFQKDPYEAFLFLLEEILEAIHPRKLVIVIDEFSIFYPLMDASSQDPKLTASLFGFLSNTIQSNNQLAFVFTGTYVLFEMRRGPVFFDMGKICNPYMVGFLDEESAKRLVTEPVKYDQSDPNKGWLTYDPRVVEVIVKQTNSHPYLIQYLCMKLVDHMNNIKYNTVNLNDINPLLDEVASSPMHEIIFLTLWDEFNSLQQQALAVIASRSETPAQGMSLNAIIEYFRQINNRITADEVIRICTNLKDAGMLQPLTSTEGEMYRIRIPIYERWLKLNKSII